MRSDGLHGCPQFFDGIAFYLPDSLSGYAVTISQVMQRSLFLC
jgi:hypothetical protein